MKVPTTLLTVVLVAAGTALGQSVSLPLSVISTLASPTNTGTVTTVTSATTVTSISTSSMSVISTKSSISTLTESVTTGSPTQVPPLSSAGAPGPVSISSGVSSAPSVSVSAPSAASSGGSSSSSSNLAMPTGVYGVEMLAFAGAAVHVAQAILF